MQAAEANSSQSSADSKNDGRKKQRTEAQKAATQRMMANRHAKSSKDDAYFNNLAIAEVWYRNQENAKEERRKKKVQDIDAIINSHLDKYHEKLMSNLQKPLTGFLDRYIDEFLEDKPNEPDPIVDAPPPKKQKEQPLVSKDLDDDIAPTQETRPRSTTFFGGSRAAILRPGSNAAQQDFSRFF